MTARERLADALYPWISDKHAALAAVDKILSLPGIAIVELPEPDDNGGGPNVGEFTAWWGRYPDNDLHQTARWPGYDVFTEEDEICYGRNNYLPEEARAFAAALLAAAECVGKAVGDGD